jgi:hypothetical protein
MARQNNFRNMLFFETAPDQYLSFYPGPAPFPGNILQQV